MHTISPPFCSRMTVLDLLNAIHTIQIRLELENKPIITLCFTINAATTVEYRRAVIPTLDGINTVYTSFRASSFGLMRNVAPVRYRPRRYGIVTMPSILDNTVRSNARSWSPFDCRVRATPTPAKLKYEVSHASY